MTRTMNTLNNNPWAVHPGAGFLEVNAVPVGTAAFEATWSLAFSHYTVTRRHASMMGAQRINQAGQATIHGTIKKGLGTPKPERRQ